MSTSNLFNSSTPEPNYARLDRTPVEDSVINTSQPTRGRRLGIIYFSDECYEDDLVMEMAWQLKLKPLNILHEIWAGRYKWTCESELFAVHLKGSEIRVYTPHCATTTKTTRLYMLET